MNNQQDKTLHDEGYNAYKRGCDSMENPYWDEQNFQQWRDGWNEAAWEDSQSCEDYDPAQVQP